MLVWVFRQKRCSDDFTDRHAGGADGAERQVTECLDNTAAQRTPYDSCHRRTHPKDRSKSWINQSRAASPFPRRATSRPVAACLTSQGSARRKPARGYSTSQLGNPVDVVELVDVDNLVDSFNLVGVGSPVDVGKMPVAKSLCHARGGSPAGGGGGSVRGAASSSEDTVETWPTLMVTVSVPRAASGP